jgi:hypothetical protein
MVLPEKVKNQYLKIKAAPAKRRLFYCPSKTRLMINRIIKMITAIIDPTIINSILVRFWFNFQFLQ